MQQSLSKVSQKQLNQKQKQVFIILRVQIYQQGQTLLLIIITKITKMSCTVSNQFYQRSSNEMDKITYKSQIKNSSRKAFQAPALKVRVIQNNLVFVNGIPSEISNYETLSSPFYFARYGFVQKIVFSSTNKSKFNSYTQAYVTYSSPIEASLAVAALEGFFINQKPLKVSYGTTKYCAYFIQGYHCPNPQCYYLHRKESQNQLTTWDSKEIFQKQVAIAMKIVTDNLELIMKSTFVNLYENYHEGFPTISGTLDLLCQNQWLSPKAEEIITNLRKQFKNSKNINPTFLISKTQREMFEDIKSYIADEDVQENISIKHPSQSTDSSRQSSDQDQSTYKIIQVTDISDITNKAQSCLVSKIKMSNFLSQSKMQFAKTEMTLDNIKKSHQIKSLILQALGK